MKFFLSGFNSNSYAFVHAINTKLLYHCYSVAQAYLNQKKLDAEAKQLQHSATNFAKQTQLWLNLVESFSSSLKEIGDAENWARSIEGDMRTIATALEYSYKGIKSNEILRIIKCMYCLYYFRIIFSHTRESKCR